MNGLVLIDKPSHCTSHDIVNRWRKLSGVKRTGHLGTLDPMATGLLALVTGTSTRLAQFFGGEEKTYLAEIAFGLVSDSYDADGEVIETGIATPAPEVIAEALASFRGRIPQTPPPVSAKKIGGVPAYKLARKGVHIELKPVEIEIKRLDILKIEGGKAEVRITSSSGTYIRSIAHDLGQRLGCGALLSRLRRTQIGGYLVEQAKTIEQLTALAEAGRLAEAVIPAASLLPQFPAEHFAPEIEAQIRQGREFRTSPFVVPPGAAFVKALSQSGALIAIGQLKFPNVYHSATVL
ncbi:MAG: tRNA pseudouridine(55) synthase TruB [Bryobacteraceae bacterium]